MAADLDIDSLYRKHGASVLRRARCLMGNESEAQEALQEVFLSLLRRPEQYRGASSITTFLYSMTTNLCLNRLRNRRNRNRLAEHHLTAGQRVASPRGADLSSAQQILASLPEEEAQLVVYYFIDEMTQDEIAGLMSMPRRQVGRRLQRVQEEIRRKERVAC